MRGAARWVLQVVGSGLLGLFGLAYAAYWIPPEAAWWLQLLAVGLPLLVVMLGLMVPVWWGQRCWWLLGGSLAALLLYALRYNALFRGEGSSDAGGDTLVVMTYNVPESRQPALGDSMAAMVARYRPQLIGFQEVGVWLYLRRGRPPAVRLIRHLRPLVERQGYQFSRPDSTQGLMFGEVVTLTQLPVIRQEVRQLASGSERWIYQAVRSELCWEGHPFVHYNVRLQSDGPVKPWEILRAGGWKHPTNWWRWLGAYRRAILQRAHQVRQLRAWIAQEAWPVVLSGDLNSTPDQWFYGQLARNMQAAGRLRGLMTPTWPATWPLVRIDHVLVSSVWEVLGMSVPAARLSDHRPVVVWLRWRQPTYAETCPPDAPVAHR